MAFDLIQFAPPFEGTEVVVGGGTYFAARADVEAKVGRDNVAKFADLNANRDAAEISARIEDALAMTFAEMNGRLRAAGFVIPLLARSGHTLPAAELRSIHADLAAHELMSARDASQPIASEDRADMENREQRAWRKLRLLILNGLSGATRIVSGGAPTAVTDDLLTARGVTNTWTDRN